MHEGVAGEVVEAHTVRRLLAVLDLARQLHNHPVLLP